MIDWYIKKNLVIKAEKTIRKISNELDQDKEYKKIVDWYKHKFIKYGETYKEVMEMIKLLNLMTPNPDRIPYINECMDNIKFKMDKVALQAFTLLIDKQSNNENRVNINEKILSILKKELSKPGIYSDGQN